MERKAGFYTALKPDGSTLTLYDNKPIPYMGTDIDMDAPGTPDDVLRITSLLTWQASQALTEMDWARN